MSQVLLKRQITETQLLHIRVVKWDHPLFHKILTKSQFECLRKRRKSVEVSEGEDDDQTTQETEGELNDDK